MPGMPSAEQADRPSVTMIEQSLTLLFEAVKWLPGLALLWFLIWLGNRPYALVTPSGKLKRGICLAREPLPAPYVIFLRTLAADLYETGELLDRKVHASFIRREGDECLIVASSRSRARLLIWVGYVDLRDPEPVLEYRTSRVGLFFALLFFGPLALLLITIPMLWWAYKAQLQREQAIIREFLQDCRTAHEAGTPLVRTILKIGIDGKRGFYVDHD